MHELVFRGREDRPIARCPLYIYFIGRYKPLAVFLRALFLYKEVSIIYEAERKGIALDLLELLKKFGYEE